MLPYVHSGSHRNGRKLLFSLGIAAALALGAPIAYKAATLDQGGDERTEQTKPSLLVQSDSSEPLDATQLSFKECEWERGKPAVPMIPNEKGFCVLTGVSGKFKSGGEWINVGVGKDGQWLLNGNSSQPRTPITVLHGSAIAIETAQRDFFKLELIEYQWNPWTPPVKMISQQDGICFLSSVRGGFIGGGEQVGVSVHDDGYWYLGGRCITAVSGKALALRAKRPGSLHARIQEYTWAPGDKPIKMIARQDGFCFLSSIEGGFQGGVEGGYKGGEWVRVYLNNGFWYLDGGSLQRSLKGKAISVSLTPDRSSESIEERNP